METELLADLIEQKCGVLTQLRQLARRQVDIVQDGETNKLLGLLAVKQTFLNQLQDLERKLDPFRSQDPESRHWRSAQHRQRARDAATRCESLLNEIILTEKQCESELIARRDTAATRLQGIHDIAQATNAYTQQTPMHSQLDLSSDR
jgi:flagellar biosynthesis/type III secretory pathway chaperone